MKTKPVYDLDKCPATSPFMTVDEARHNGYRHGYQGKVTTGVCIFAEGTDKYKAWQEGYSQGCSDSRDVFSGRFEFSRDSDGAICIRLFPDSLRPTATVTMRYGTFSIAVAQDEPFDLSFADTNDLSRNLGHVAGEKGQVINKIGLLLNR